MNRQLNELISFFTMIFGILIMGIIIATFVRLQRGFLGVILSGLAFVLLIFWIKEIKKFFKGSGRIFSKAPISGADLDETWPYDLFDLDDERVLVAKVPGPKKAVKVKSSDKKLEIIGGQNFSRVLTMPEKINVKDFTYKNGVLQVRFKKKGTQIHSMT